MFGMKNNKVKMPSFLLRFGVLCALCAGLLLACTGCGTEADLSVWIVDGQYETNVMVSSGMTVAQTLEAAEITLGDDDCITPSLESVVDGEETIVIERSVTVTLWEDEASVELNLVGATVADALDAANIVLGGNDVLNHSTEAYLTDGMEIVVEHYYEVELIVNGEAASVLTNTKTVEAFLAEQEISLEEQDRVSPEVQTALADGLSIEVNFVTTKQVTETEEIAYSTTYESSSNLYSGETSVKQAGKNGTKELVYEVTYVDGVEESRELVSETVIEEPTTEIILKGTKEKTTVATDSSKTVQSIEKSYDCDGSGHGWYIITYTDGTVDYKEF